MRVIVQRVSFASVKVNEDIIGQIAGGLLVFVGVEEADNENDADWLMNKIRQLRIFNDDNGVMNLSVEEVKGELLIISQFTLYAKTKKGNRPSYIRAAQPEKAKVLYSYFVKRFSDMAGLKVQTGIFGAHMEVSSVNDGPVTIWMDTQNKE